MKRRYRLIRRGERGSKFYCVDIGDGHAQDVAGQVTQGLVTAAGVECMDHPRAAPYAGGNSLQQPGVSQRGFEFGAEDHRQGAHGHQKRRKRQAGCNLCSTARADKMGG